METKFSDYSLKYDLGALSPTISRATLELHHGKHLKAYRDNLNKLFNESDYDDNATLEDVVCSASGPLFNNAAQVWNHIFYFDTFTPTPERDAPIGSLLRAIELFFGSFEEFKAEFERQGNTLFGSGWVWLSKDSGDELKITQESNAGNPLREGLTPLLTFDVWEHAYYVDHQNRRAEQLSKLWNIVNWVAVEERYMHQL
ncbi:MAG: superoxide dismutase [Rikenellaceae bacterium]